MHEFYLSLLVLEGEVLGTVGAKPEMLDGSSGGVEAKEPASI
jgi:hypothetical protein